MTVRDGERREALQAWLQAAIEALGVAKAKAEVAKATMNPLLSLFKSEKVCSSAASERFLSYPSLTAQALVCSLSPFAPFAVPCARSS